MPDAADPVHRTRYGRSNPEPVENALWQTAITEDWSGGALRAHLDAPYVATRGRFDVSAYRDTLPGPFWSWRRLGGSITDLPDGRILHVGGEHEDYYDMDFCIYNDVVVQTPGAGHAFYLYPKEIFPPTDFHSATRIDQTVFLIGSLGYRDLRQAGRAQVLRLDTVDLRIEPVATAGDDPGWIFSHEARQIGAREILVTGGRVYLDSDRIIDNPDRFVLDTTSATWRRV